MLEKAGPPRPRKGRGIQTRCHKDLERAALPPPPPPHPVRRPQSQHRIPETHDEFHPGKTVPESPGKVRFGPELGSKHPHPGAGAMAGCNQGVKAIPRPQRGFQQLFSGWKGNLRMPRQENVQGCGARSWSPHTQKVQHGPGRRYPTATPRASRMRRVTASTSPTPSTRRGGRFVLS